MKNVLVSLIIATQLFIPNDLPSIVSDAYLPETVIELVAPTPTPVPMEVRITSSRTVVVHIGDPIYLTSELIGFEGYEVWYQWCCDKGEGFEEIEDANEPTYVFAASPETLSWNYKLIVYYKGVVE